MSECTIDGCTHPHYAEGVCFFHYPLWEAWGYNDGYMIYMEEGREEGRRQFKLYLGALKHQEIVDILARQDYQLAETVIQTYSDLTNNEDTN